MRRRTVVAGMAALAAAALIGGGARRRSVHEGTRWDELPANSAVTIAALMSETMGRVNVEVVRLSAGAAGSPRHRGVS